MDVIDVGFGRFGRCGGFSTGFFGSAATFGDSRGVWFGDSLFSLRAALVAVEGAVVGIDSRSSS